MVQDRKTNPGAKTTEGDETFVERWSRRKREDRAAGQRLEQAATTPDAPTDPGPSDADLPPPESLGPDSDYSGYLSGRVSEGLRRAALRRLFRLPQFNVRDGLDDYDEDYRSFAALGETVTADMRHHEQRLRDKARAAGERAEAADEDDGVDTRAADSGEPGAGADDRDRADTRPDPTGEADGDVEDV